MSKYKELVKKLKEIFQIDRPELDFGIYRILNAKGDEINDYLENTLKKKISDALATAGNANKDELEKQLSTAIKAAEDAGFNPEDSPKVKDLRQQIIATSQGANEYENTVFTHMLAFFSRYYDSGDFVSKRRYKGDTYAIPYAGEEVMLHWANKDQYYIKSGENFANYSFKLEDGRKVSFKLLTADIAKDNRKDNDADRRFVLIEPHTRIKFDEDGSEYEEEYQPVSVIKLEESEELVIQFEYKALKKGTKQEPLVDQALQSVLASEPVQSNWLDITTLKPTEKKPNRTLLEKHLTTYTQRNTADYFIHKNLGEFLSNELDFYIKNEVMNLDNVQNADVFFDIERQLRTIQCFRLISKDIVTFLSQLEDFQKKLWTKRKFVIESKYFVSVDKLDETILKDISDIKAQWEQWKDFGFIDSDSPEDLSNLIENKSLIIDSSLMPKALEEKIIMSLGNIDDLLTGTLVNSDNYQALRILQEKYKNSVNTIYIDPPYNTDAAPILYKNGYRNSSWLTFLNDRIEQSYGMLKDDGVLCATIDDYEHNEFAKVIKQKFGEDNSLGTVAVRINPSGRITLKGLAQSHEYAIFTGKSDKSRLYKMERSDDQNARFKNEDDKGHFEWRNFRREGSSSDRAERPKRYFPIYVVEDSFRVPSMDWDESIRNYINIEPEKAHEKVVWPIDATGRERVWRWGIERILKESEEILPKINNKGVLNVYYKYRPNDEGVTPPSVWTDKKYSATEYGTNQLKKLFGNQSIFDFPKSIHAVEDCIDISGMRNKKSMCLDYFAGSGTTGHAVINLNRKDSGDRKFILVEQGKYFDTITTPRVLKAAFSEDWSNGKPKSKKSSSILIKSIKLEGYEDTLNNLELKKPQQQLKLLDELSDDAKSDYLLNYMLETESKGSLLSTDDFKNPFSYKMKIAADSAGASEETNINLVETFNYLIGLHVNTIESNIERGYVRIEGKLPSGERALVLWRDCEKIQYNDFTKFASRFDLFAKQKTFDVIYVNGDHNLPTAFTNDEGEVTRTLKLRQIEPEFLEQMFAPDDLA